jgi:hypothetical protein
VDEINALRKVRNIFAHEIDASFTHPRVISLCKRPPILNAEKTDRDAFLDIAIGSGVALIHRDLDMAERDKRKILGDPTPQSLLNPSPSI